MDAMQRAGDLKGELSQYAQSPRFHRASREAILEAFPGGVVNDEMTFSAALDAFIFTQRLDGGQTVVELFAETLTGDDRALVLSWTDYVQGVFEIKEPYGDDGFVAVNHIDELTYRIRSNMGPAGVEQLTPGVVMIGGIVPVGDDWMISGASMAFPAEDASTALAGVRDLQLRSPKLVFRNPEKLAQARELQAAQRASFVDLYGSDLIVVPGAEVKEKMLAFYRHDYERAGSKGGPWTDPELPDPGFAEMGTVAIVFDEEAGLGFHPDFDLLQEVFASPALVVRGRYREVVSGYLRGDDVSPGILRRLAAEDPGKASEVFRKLLKKPRFSWENDGEALLRKHKPGWYDGPRLPRVIPV
ncbi:hypothetical protein [Nonomuraea cavernae]|uniref:Uncharacterized protein n=1 Tax=Nonomuraea cavernae TaxID=2045107 RepID=A0A917ZE60_9ACTN|nr:hypothetical protein [Nonomuraea cavernae]MCA2189533.1 hypothetical protein [Nonomuraea cavernae]GGO81695.1 hypothetical protein GCM10012289_71260 [Nonomuraea cavernae]